MVAYHGFFLVGRHIRFRVCVFCGALVFRSSIRVTCGVINKILLKRLMNLEMEYVNFVRNVVYICDIVEVSQICGDLYCVTFSEFSIFHFTLLIRCS